MKKPQQLFYHLDTNGEGTNLQLYSLRQSVKAWEELQRDREELSTSQIQERAAFIITNLSVSLSQLLGQNAPILKDRIDSPRQLLQAFVAIAKLDAVEQQRLINLGVEIFAVSEACRHFGKDSAGEKHRLVSTLTFEDVDRMVEGALDIWDAALSHYKSVGVGSFDDFESIRDLI